MALAARCFQFLYFLSRITRPLTLRQSLLVDGGNGNQNSIVCSMPRTYDEMDNISLGRRLRILRTTQKVSQTELASRIGVSYQQVQKYENGENAPTIFRMKGIAAALGVRPCEICGCCDEKSIV